MRLTVFMILFAVSALAATAQTDGQMFVLPGGDYRWVPLAVRQVPVQVEVSFEVSEGGPTVHMELVPEAAFRPMQRGRAHETIGGTGDSRSGTLRQVVKQPGNYRVVIANKNGADPATVRWVISTDLSPEPVSRELSPKRRVATMFVSFVLFFAMVGYSGWRLKNAIRE